MLENNNDNLKTGRHRMFLLGILCLSAFCLVAQVVPNRIGGQSVRSKVFLLHSDVLKKNKKILFIMRVILMIGFGMKKAIHTMNR